MSADRVLRQASLPFPAVVTAPGGKHWAIARLLVSGGELLIFGYGEGKVRLEARFTLADWTIPGAVGRGETRTWTFTDADGSTWYVTKGNGCGCGSPLRRANLRDVMRQTEA